MLNTLVCSEAHLDHRARNANAAGLGQALKLRRAIDAPDSRRDYGDAGVPSPHGERHVTSAF